MIAIYTLAALPFFTGGAVISLAITRLRKQVNIVYGADLIGAAAGCLLLLPLLNRFGAPGVVLLAAVLGGVAALLFSPAKTHGADGAARRAGRRHPRRPAAARDRRRSTSATRRGTTTTRCCSASGIRFRASPCTTARTATGR